MPWALAVIAMTLLVFAAISGRIAGSPVVRLKLPRPTRQGASCTFLDLRGRG